MVKYKKSLILFIRIVIGAGLLIFLFWKTDIEKLTSVVKQASPFYLILSGILFLVAVIVISFRWKILLDAHSINIPFRLTISYYLVGFFFNNFLPTGVGLDIVRAVYASNNYGKKAECFASVISERLIGFFALLLIGVVFLPMFVSKSHFLLLVFLGIIFLIVLFVLGIILFTKKRMLRKFSFLLRFKIFIKLRESLKRLYEALYYYKGKKSVVLYTLLLSFLFQILLITMAFCIGQAFSIKIPYHYFLSFIPAINIASMVPITINGIGIREGLYVYLFKFAGIDSSRSLLLSISYLVITMAVSLIGAVIFIFGMHIGKKGGQKI